MSGPLYVGIDVGSSATKCILLDQRAEVVGHHVLPSGFNYADVAKRVLAESLSAAGATAGQVTRCVATGYGRRQVETATRFVTEITCHARGAREWYPQVRHIIDVGGQDTKVIQINDAGQMVDYRMNAKCAAGTGTFLESIALKVGLSLKEIDQLAMTSTADTVVNSYCTVFAGTEVIERIKEGQPREDIAMGLFRSIASRVREMMNLQDGPVAVTGGVVAHCLAMKRALEEILETDVLLPPLPQHAGAYGGALLAFESKAVQGSEPSHAARR